MAESPWLGAPVSIAADDAAWLGIPAAFSPCRTYRYALWRVWGPRPDVRPPLVVIGLNPSTADETQDDPTIRRCVGFARDLGFGSLCMLNLFAFRATDPADMRAAADPVGPDNDAWLSRLTAGAGLVLAAWGVHGTHRGRAEQVARAIPGLHCLGLTKDRHPRHPLYLPKTARPIRYGGAL